MSDSGNWWDEESAAGTPSQQLDQDPLAQQMRERLGLSTNEGTPATGRKRGKTIEEKLLEDGKRSEKEKELLRQAHHDREMQEYQATPKISKTAANLRRKEMAIEERLVQFKNEKESKIQQAADAERARESKHLTHNPSLNQTTIALASSYSQAEPEVSARLARWSQDRIARLEAEKKRLEAQKEDDIIGNPTINPVSAALARRDPSVPIEDRLLAKGAEKELRRQQLERQIAKEATPLKKQRERLANVDHDAVVDRLMEYNEKKTHKLEMLRQEEEDRLLNITARQERLGSAGKVYSEPLNPLMLEALQYGEEVKRRRQMQYRAMLEKQQKIHPRGMSKKSQEIVSKMNTTHEERLLNNSREAPSYVNPDLTFHPRVTQRSTAIVERRDKSIRSAADGKDKIQKRLEVMHKMDEEFEKHRSELRNQYEQQEMAQCTFKPKINERSLKKVAQRQGADDVITRSLKWEARRAQRLKEKREQEEKEKLKDCKFTPVTHPSPKKPAKSLLETVEETHQGVSAFLARQKAAREQRELEKNPPKRTQDWTIEPTKPVGFQFNHRLDVQSIKKVQPRRLMSRRTGEVELPEDLPRGSIDESGFDNDTTLGADTTTATDAEGDAPGTPATP